MRGKAMQKREWADTADLE